ncbi:MAG TPA: DUF4157 domain-containing protein [Thermoanaerobaculia bacterium]|jgi:hypothetical protein|nr:DUF4157 domain-containing protein [Thermoanaerobaculia bacterium]
MNLPEALAKATSDAISESRAKVCVGYPWWLRPWLMRDVIGITLGRRIYLNAKAAPASLERLLRHELAHVRQINELGLFVFYWRYLAEFVRHYRRVRSISEAYAKISFEREAVAAEEGAVL